jgi:hypothetical protein
VRDPNDLLTTVFQELSRRLPDLGSPVPDRAYISSGNAVAYDMEQLTVNLNRISGGQPGLEDVNQFVSFAVFFAEVQITLLRNAPMARMAGNRPKLPSTDDEQSAAAVQVTDMMALTQALQDMRSDGSLTNQGVPVSIGPTMPYGPSGGIVGSLAVVAVQLV